MLDIGQLDKLTEAGLTAQQKKCAELLIMKDINKMTLEDIAKAVNIDTSTLYRWRKKKEFNDYLNSVSEEFQRSFLSDAFSQLRRIMVHGKDSDKLKAIELILKNQGKLKADTDVNNTTNVNIDVDKYLKELGL